VQAAVHSALPLPENPVILALLLVATVLAVYAFVAHRFTTARRRPNAGSPTAKATWGASRRSRRSTPRVPWPSLCSIGVAPARL